MTTANSLDELVADLRLQAGRAYEKPKKARYNQAADTIERLRDALTEARPFVANSAQKHYDVAKLLVKIDTVLANQGPDYCGWVETEQRPEADHD